MWQCSEFRCLLCFSETKEQAEEEIVRCCGTFYDNLKVEKVSTISSERNRTVAPDWLMPKVYKGEEEEVQF